MVTFHSTLENFFRKNFHEEIQRLAMDSHSRDAFLSSRPHLPAGSAVHYQPYSEQHSIDYSSHDSPSSSGPSALDLRQTVSNATSLPAHPVRGNGQVAADGALLAKQTPLQRGLAHLARHGVNGVASSPRDTISSDIGELSPRDSFINGSGAQIANISGSASVTTSTMGSIGSIRGRFSRFGSLSFGRRDG